jgi:hypothetical protein
MNEHPFQSFQSFNRFAPFKPLRLLTAHLVHETKRLCAWKGLRRRVGFERQLMRQLEYVQVFYAFHFDSPQRTSTKHELGSYHVPWILKTWK